MAGGKDLDIALLIKAQTAQAKAQLAQVRAELAGVGEASAKASATSTAASQTSAAASKTEAAAVANVVAAKTAQGETEEQARARIHAMVQASTQAAEADGARAAAAMKTAGSLHVAADANSALSKSTAGLVEAQNAQMVNFGAFSRAAKDASAATTALKSGTLTSAAFEKAVNDLGKAVDIGAISQVEYVAALKLADKAKIKDIALTEAQSAANKGAALNSRAVSEIGTAASEVLAGNFGRLRRTGAAFANQSGLIARVMTPVGLGITAAAVAVGTFVAGILQGEKQTERFNRALISTGGYAGTAAGQMLDMANSIGRASGRYGDAAQALTALATTGKYTRSQLQQLTQTALDFATMTGGEVADGVKFVDAVMSGNIATIAKLDQQYHFLTATQFDEIQRLIDQGQQEKATALAQQAASKAAHDRAQEVEDSAGILIKAGHAVAAAWHDAWNAIKDLGATHSWSQQLADAEKALTAARGTHPNRAGYMVQNASPEEIAALQAQIADLKQKVVAQAFAQNNGGTYLGPDGKQHDVAGAVNDNAETKAKAAGAAAEAWLAPIDKLHKDLDAAVEAKRQFFLVPHDAAATEKFLRSYNNHVQQIAQAYDSATKAPKGAGGKKAALANDLKALQDQLLSLGGQALGPVTAIWDRYNKAVANAKDTAAKAIKAGGNAADVQAQVQKIQTAAGQARDNALAKLHGQLAESLAQATGDAATAARLQIEQQYGLMLEDMQRRGDTAGVALVKKLINVGQARAQLQALQQQVQTTLADMSRQEQTIQAEQQAGLISDYTARQRILELHQSTAAELDKLIPKYRELAVATGDPRAIEALKNLEAELGRMQLHISDVQQALQSGFESGLEQALEGLASGTMKVSDAFRTLAQSVAQSLAQVAARALAAKAMDAISGLFGGGNKSADMAQGATKVTVAGGVLAGASILLGSNATKLQAAADALLVANTVGAVGGFASGGYTGAGGVHDIAGFVHAGEVVFSQRDVARAGGVSNVESIRRRGYADGGYVHPLRNAPTPAQIGFTASRQPRMDFGALAAANDGAARGPAVGVRIVNSVDPDFVTGAMNSSTGETVIMNTIARNQTKIKQMVR